MYRSAAALFTTWSRASRLKLIVITSTIGRKPGDGRADAGAHEGRLGQRGVTDPLGPELVEQAHAHREGTAVAADVLAHEEDPRIAFERLAHPLPNRLPVRDHGAGPVV